MTTCAKRALAEKPIGTYTEFWLQSFSPGCYLWVNLSIFEQALHDFSQGLAALPYQILSFYRWLSEGLDNVKQYYQSIHLIHIFQNNKLEHNHLVGDPTKRKTTMNKLCYLGFYTPELENSSQIYNLKQTDLQANEIKFNKTFISFFKLTFFKIFWIVSLFTRANRVLASSKSEVIPTTIGNRDKNTFGWVGPWKITSVNRQVQQLRWLGSSILKTRLYCEVHWVTKSYNRFWSDYVIKQIHKPSISENSQSIQVPRKNQIFADEVANKSLIG